MALSEKDIIDMIVDSDDDNKFTEIFNKTKAATRLNYSEASVLANKIPLIVVLGYSLGLKGIKQLCKKADIKEIDKRNLYNPDKESIIRFNDGYLRYLKNAVDFRLHRDPANK